MRMKWLNILGARLHGLFRRESVLQDIEEELRIHIEMETEANIRHGMSPDEARAAALKSFGNPSRHTERGYDVRGGGWMEPLWQDLRYGARMLLKAPGFTAVAVLSLALGIGATTTVFSLANAVLLRPLPVKDSDTLFTLDKPGSSNAIHAISYPDYLDYRARNEVFSDLLVWCEASLSINLDGQAEQAYGMIVSGNYFSLLGVQPALGRFFSAEEDRTPGSHPVAVLSFALWQNRFGGDPSVIGRNLKINGHPLTVIGVAPKGFTSTYNVFAPALYLPLMMQGQTTSNPEIFDQRMSKYLKITGRLKPGVSREGAQTALNLLDRQLEQDYPEKGETSVRPHLGVELVPVGSFPWEIRLALLGGASLLLAIVGSVLLIACANVAGLLLARATVRQREIAVRLALGATRRRLIRQMLTESCLLFCVAGALGVGLTVGLTRLLSTITLPVAFPFALEPTVDWRVLSFTLLLALLTGTIFGLAPALEAARADLQTALKDAPSGRGVRRSRMREAFVIGQIALSLVLLISAGLCARALQFAQTIYPGMQPETVLTASMDPRQQGYSVARAREFYRQLTERVAALPGVEAVSLVRELQVGDGYATTSVAIKDAPEQKNVKVETNTIAPGYFQTLGIALLVGRDFTPADREGAPRVVVINEAMARRYWPGTSALGKQIGYRTDQWAEIIGVVENGKHRAVGQASAPFVYWAFLQSQSDNSDMSLVVRQRGDTAQALAAVRREVQALDPDLPVKSLMTLSETVRLMTLPWRAAGLLANIFGFIGLTLAALGIYGLVSYTVNQRTHEIGVRMALGANVGDVIKLVIRHGMKMALIGIGLGLTVSAALTQTIKDLLFGVSATDPTTFAVLSLLLAGVALLACYIPARRATKIDPMVALRHQ